MLLFMCKSKIHRVRLTGKELHYEGSVGVDETLLKAAHMLPGEQVQVLNVCNGQRFETYTIAEKAGSGKVILYGPAARLGEIGDTLILISYALMSDEEARAHRMAVVKVDEKNRKKT
jgi:aspartate 1-decarboxylase